ncbi:unnamed protein product [Parnassius apollo]|uniref:(apollo) hypothetical protein n=1 Tax=Parnassius apollo TaxID=110799 RepID=A0A8S3WH47_PARAO|nr:unnamed protein product [Parnassius apollo]
MQSEDADLRSPPGRTNDQSTNGSETKYQIKNVKDPTAQRNVDEDPEIAHKTKEYIPKPEPIFVTGIVNITPLRELIVKVEAIDKFTMTTLSSGHIIKLVPVDIETYKTIRDNLIKNNINHYTYKLKSERAYRVVISGLHASENIDMIKEELQAIRQIVNVLHRTTKEKLPLYFVDLEPQANNKDIFSINTSTMSKLQSKHLTRKKKYCNVRDVKDLGTVKINALDLFTQSHHPTSACTKTPESEAVCANCQGRNPASYKGCIKYKQYKEKILSLKPAQQPKQTNVTTHPKQSINENDKSTHHTGFSYAGVLKNKRNNSFTQSRVPILDASQQNITSLLDTMFERFQKIINDLMDRMIDQIIKLITRLTAQRD